MSQPLSIGACVNDGWNGFKRNAGVAIVGFLVYLAVAFAGGMIPFFNIVFSLFIIPALAGGLTILSLNLLRNNSPAVGNIFRGFQKYSSFLGAYWLLLLIALVCLIPVGIGYLIRELSGSDALAALVILGIVSAIILIVVMLRWCMVYYLIADGSAVMPAFRESARITKGYRWTIFLLGIVNALIMILGVLALVVGYFVAAPVVMVAYASAYERLKGFAASAVRAPIQ